MSIIGLHAIVHTAAPEATREFFRDILKLPFVDAGRGWLIFASPPAELAVHPHDGQVQHELFLMCDDLDATIDELRAKGVETQPVTVQRWGRLTRVKIPGGDTIGMYEPTHPLAIDRTADE